MKRYFIYTLLFLISQLVLGCALTIKPAASKSAKSFYESFFVGEDGTQYFIKPLEFSAEGNQDKLFVDFTFRYKDELKDSGVVNVSIERGHIIKSLDDIIFTNTNSTVVLEDISLLFNEKKGQKFISRFSAKCSTKEMVDLFNDSNIKIEVKESDSSLSFFPNKNSQKAIRSLNDNLYILFK